MVKNLIHNLSPEQWIHCIVLNQHVHVPGGILWDKGAWVMTGTHCSPCHHQYLDSTRLSVPVCGSPALGRAPLVWCLAAPSPRWPSDPSDCWCAGDPRTSHTPSWRRLRTKTLGLDSLTDNQHHWTGCISQLNWANLTHPSHTNCKVKCRHFLSRSQYR